jgi:hypothetical protein
MLMWMTLDFFDLIFTPQSLESSGATFLTLSMSLLLRTCIISQRIPSLGPYTTLKALRVPSTAKATSFSTATSNFSSKMDKIFTKNAAPRSSRAPPAL